jgi:hypothetical protein
MRYDSFPCNFYANLTFETVHCKWRKRPCLLSDGDDQKRCKNCVELEIECSFMSSLSALRRKIPTDPERNQISQSAERDPIENQAEIDGKLSFICFSLCSADYDLIVSSI